MKKEINGNFFAQILNHLIPYQTFGLLLRNLKIVPNDDWFDDFCSKIAPCYIPSDSEIVPCYNHYVSPTHVLTNDFNMSELTYAIASRKFTASGLDNISPVMLKHLPASALDALLALMNNIYLFIYLFKQTNKFRLHHGAHIK